jgi:transposase
MSTLCILSSDGAPERPKPIKTTREAFSAFFTRPAAHVILEVGTHSRWVSQLLEQLGINFVRGLVKSFGEGLPACETEAFHTQAKDRIPASLQPALTPVLGMLTQLHEQMRACDKQLQQLAKKYPDVEGVSQPKGVGLLTALVFVLSLEDKGRFTSSRQVGAYLGLRPRQEQSGDTDKQLRITKAGDAYLRRLLVNCATYILGPFGAESDLRSWGLQLASRGGKNAKRRARVAVARKLAVLMHRLWVTGEQYEPVGYKPKRAAA